MPPPRDPSAPPTKNRRRPEAMPGGWLWLVLLILLVMVMIFFVGFGSGTTIDYSDVERLAEAGKTASGNSIIKRVDIIGDRLEGELHEEWRNVIASDRIDPVADKKKLEAIAKRVRSNKFNALIVESALRGGDSISAMLRQNNVDYGRKEDSTTWIATLLI